MNKRNKAMAHFFTCHLFAVCMPCGVHVNESFRMKEATGPVANVQMSHLFTRYNVFHLSVMSHSSLCHDSVMCVPWLIDLFAKTH